MKIVKPLTLGILHKPFQYQRRNFFSVAALGFFRLGENNERFLTENLQWPLVVSTLPGGQALDEVMSKPNGEVLLLGKAFSPGGKPTTEMHVRLHAAGVDKTLRVIGEREWLYGLLPFYRVTKPQPFTEMPLIYERAYGGKGHPANPAGCGYTGNPLAAFFGRNQGVMPNIEYAGRPVGSHWRRSAPAGYGPVNVTWSPRRHKFGTYNRRWLQRDAPGFASDIDWTLFNLAPVDQWLSGYFRGNEPYRLEGLHPNKTVIEGRLPTLRARAFVLQVGQSPDAAAEVPLQFDTVWFLPEHELGIAIYHGQVEIGDSDALDVAAVMVGYEQSDDPKSLSHYREVLALRTDSKTAALHAFDESQLSAEYSTATLTRRVAERRQAEAAERLKRQQQLDEMDAEFWANSGRTPPPDHVPPRADPLPLGLVTSQAIRDGDFDLAKTIEHARALADDVQKQAVAKLAELQKETNAVAAADSGVEFASALARAEIPAYDLLPPTEAGQDPQLAELLTALERAHQAGELADAGQYEQARQVVLHGPALRRCARRAAPTPSLPAIPLLPEVALQLGVRVRQWKEAGLCLAGRDLAGVNLRGIDLSGADLREIMLEGADLTDAKFVGANLHAAVLTGAVLSGADFSGAILADAGLSGSKGTGIRFSAANLAKAHAIGAEWPRADLSGSRLDGLLGIRINLTGAVLNDIHANRAVFLEATADDSLWQRANLEKTVALRARLARADFRNANLVKTILIEADMQDSIWDQARWVSIQGTGRTNWSGASLRAVRAESCGMNGATFANADFSAARFMRCDFGNGNLSGAKLDDGVFSRSLFLHTNLQRVSARHTDFFQALCRKTDFTDADLYGASFAGAELTGAIRDAEGSESGRHERQRRLA